MKVRILVGLPEFYWSSVRQVRNRVFDLRHRTDTCRKFIEADTRVMTGPNAVYGSQYAPVDAEGLRKAIRSLRIRYSDYTLVDLGSGKGKAVMVAANFPFKSVVGIEYSRLLNRVARTNLENPKRPFTRSRSVHIVHADAVHFPPPEGPLVVLLCDPFRGPVLRDMLQHLKSNIEENPRPLKLIYMNPEEPELISDALGFWPSMQLVRRQHGVRIFSLDLARMRRQVAQTARAVEEAAAPETVEEQPQTIEAPEVTEPVTAEAEVPSIAAAAAASEQVAPEPVQREEVPATEPVAEEPMPVGVASASDPVHVPSEEPVEATAQDEEIPEPIAVVMARAGQVIEFPKRAAAASAASNGDQRRMRPVAETGQVAIPRAAAAGSRGPDVSARTRPELTVQRSTASEQDLKQRETQRRERSEQLAAAILEAVRHSRKKAERAAATQPDENIAAESGTRKPPVVESGRTDRAAAQKNGTHPHQQVSGTNAESSAGDEDDPATDAALRTALYGRAPNEWPEDD